MNIVLFDTIPGPDDTQPDLQKLYPAVTGWEADRDGLV